MPRSKPGLATHRPPLHRSRNRNSAQRVPKLGPNFGEYRAIAPAGLKIHFRDRRFEQLRFQRMN